MLDSVADHLAADDQELEHRWKLLHQSLAGRFGENLGIEGILFLIGIQEQGLGFEPRLRKERKQDVIMFGTHCAMESIGLYARSQQPDEIVWERRVVLPNLSIEEQEKLLRVAIIRYFVGRPGFEFLSEPIGH